MIDKDTQDRVWQCAPKAFRDAVKARYVGLKSTADNIYNSKTTRRKTQLHIDELEHTFGSHNLTSDAEPEDIICVRRKKLQDIYAKAQADYDSCNDHVVRAFWEGRARMLYEFFGSKCLPDNVDNSDDSKTEPKYHKDEKVCYNGYVYEIEGLVGKNRYSLKGLNFDLDEDMIDPYEPYTEPNNNMEEKELNLCEILKGHEGIKIFLPDGGEVKLLSVEDNEIEVVKENGEKIYLRGESIILISTGFAYIYPSREFYLKYPLDARKAWQEWQEEQKPKRWRAEKGETYCFLKGDGYIEIACDYYTEDNDNHYRAMNYFASTDLARQAAEAVRKCLEEIHKSNQQ